MVTAVPLEKRQEDVTALDLTESGWRVVEYTEPDGTLVEDYIPLTPEDFLYPEEGYVMPNSIFHDTAADDLKDMLKHRYADDPTVGVFRDLRVVWDNPQLRPNCPDVSVAFGIRDKHRNRHDFVVAEEGVVPAIVFEVVSPCYRREDRRIKVGLYARAGVPEYIILDRFERARPPRDEIIGYFLDNGRYVEMIPDDEGRLLCQSLGLWISLRDGRVVLEDAVTGERLLNSQEEADRRKAAEAQLAQEQAAREAAETRVRQLEARLRELGLE